MFDFPNNPSDGQQVIHPNGSTYTYQLNEWVIDRDGLAELTTRINFLESQSLFLLE